jgi:hypothetical protein
MRAISCGISNFQDYLILGDDIVIANKEVAESYIKTIESIGISISIPKSVISNDTHFGVEFASRYIIAEGVDISPLSIGHLLSLQSKDCLLSEMSFLNVVMNSMLGQIIDTLMILNLIFL